jgi:hypothetical protein
MEGSIVSLEHDDWDAKLACSEFAINVKEYAIFP